MIYVMGGGGLAVPFRVFSGTSAPSSPKSFDLWIKTSTPVLNCQLRNSTYTTSVVGQMIVAYEPTVEGNCAATSNSPGLYILNQSINNFLYRMPIKLTLCKVSTGSSWSNVNAYIYKNSQWVQFSSEGWMVNNGSVVVSPTKAKAPASATGTYTYDMSNGAKVTAAYGNKTYCCMYWVIDASKYTTLTFTAVSSNGANTCTTWDVSTNLNGDFSGNKLKNELKTHGASGTDTKSLDITNYTGTLYLRFGFESGNGGETSSLTITDARCT